QIMYGAPYEPVLAAVSWAPGRLDVFARGTDGALWHQAGDGHSFWGWESLGGFIIGAPQVVAWGPNRLDIFVRGGARNMYHRPQAVRKSGEGSPGSYGRGLVGRVAGPISVTASAPGRPEGVDVGAGQAICDKAWQGGWDPSQSDWESLGGQGVGTPQVVSWGN